jgi:tetratricopeptide (TPR) repeat protein
MLNHTFESDGLPAPVVTAAPINDQDRQGQGSGFQLYETVTKLMRTHHYTAVLLTLAEAAPTHHQDALFWHYQGEALANLGRYKEALQSFDRALERHPEAIATLVFQAVCWIHLQAFERALGCCDRTLAIAPHDSQAWLFRGVALQRLGQYRAAYSSYDQALNITRPSLRQRITRTLNRWLGSPAPRQRLQAVNK